MPSFDYGSEGARRESRNAVAQAQREIGTRFDFKGTDTSVELGDGSITLVSVNEDRLNAARTVLEEKLVKRKVALKALDYGREEDEAGGRKRQVARLQAGIDADRARDLNESM